LYAGVDSIQHLSAALRPTGTTPGPLKPSTQWPSACCRPSHPHLRWRVSRASSCGASHSKEGGGRSRRLSPWQ